jgi:hypothetical protein
MTIQPRGIPLRPDRRAFAQDQRRSLIRAITSVVLSGVDRSPSDVLKAWPNDDGADLILRAISSPITTSDYPAAQSIVLLPELAPQSAALRLFTASMTLDMAGIGTVRIPHPTVLPVPLFIAEGQPAPVAQIAFADTVVGPMRKILILSSVSGELEKAAPETASAIIGRVLANAVTKSLDVIAFGSAPADSAQPAGLLHNVVPLTASTATGLEAAAADIGAMASAMADAGVDPEGMIIVAAPKQATSLRLLSGPNFNNPIFGTAGFADGTVAAFAQGAAFGGAPTIERSKHPTTHFEDTNPLPISTPGSPNTIAAPVRSAFQMALIAIRVRADATWAVIAPGGAQVIVGCNW